MNTEQFYKMIEGSRGNESNICQTHAIKEGKIIYNGCWRGYKTEDAVNGNNR